MVPEDLDESASDDLEDIEDDEDLDLDIDEDDLGEDEDGDLDIDEDEDEDEEDDEDGETAAAARSGEESDEDEDEEAEDEDVEASLDVILKERLVVEDEVEDDELTDVEDRTEQSERVLPKQPDEFVCKSCFLVKHASQLADKRRGLCRDCV
jgi:hypothetical protein